jgi:signal transduction histidine kinase
VSSPVVDPDRVRKLQHDLRSPLVVIGGFAQLLASDRVISDADRRSYAETIETAAQEMQRLIDGALSAS